DITNIGGPAAGISDTVHVSCQGGNDGSATVTVNGGTLPLSYSWNTAPVQTAPTANNLTAGSYTVEVTDSNNCVVSVDVEITEPALLNILTGYSDISCFGGNNGTARVTATGGTAPYTYSWPAVTLANDSTAIDLAFGNYTVLVTDAKGCDTSYTFSLGQPFALTLSLDSTDVSCNGGNNGSVTANPGGGTVPYNYLWNTLATTQTVNGLTANTYTVTITDQNGCKIADEIVVNQPNPIVLTTGKADATCSDANGSASVTATGGTGTYTYNWITTGESTQAINNLSPNTYEVTVTDANGCKQVASVSITNISGATAIMTDSTNVSINGGSDGSATASATGGTVPYSYSWTTTPGQTTATAVGLQVGSYCVTVRDANNCWSIACVDINEPEGLGIILSQTDVSCKNGSDGTAKVSATGGVGPYNYLWSPGGQTTASIAALQAGDYTVSVSDANGAGVKATITVSEPNLLTVTSTSQDATCNGICDGSIDITAAGGTLPYNYSWSNGSTLEDQAGLCQGIYTVSVTDAKNCNVSLKDTINEPQLLLTTATGDSVNCPGGNDGIATITSTGGTQPYTYSWSNGGITQTIINLAVGTYCGTVTDKNGCKAYDCVDIAAPYVISADMDSTDITCKGADDGKVTAINVTGGVGSYQYSIDGGGFGAGNSFSNLTPGLHTMTIKDANNCSYSFPFTINEPSVITADIDSIAITCNTADDGQASAVNVGGGVGTYQYSIDGGAFGASNTFTNLTPGNHTITIRDANNCPYDFNFSIYEPDVISADMDSVAITCNGDNNGQASAVNVTGGVGTYQYSIDGGAFGASNAFNNLTPGAHTITIRDANNCPYDFSLSIYEPDVITADMDSVAITCNGDNNGQASAVNVTGGVGSYEYSIDGGTFGAGNSLSNLTPGAHTITIRDANNCPYNFNLSIYQPSVITADIDSTAITCNGANNGQASAINVAGGVGSYEYSIDGGVFGASNSFSDLTPGVHTITIRDANLCPYNFGFSIYEPDVIIAQIDSIGISCEGENDGQATAINVTGGVGSYEYSIDGSPVWARQYI
ncbi:SprB repeat-containing protein, partial [Bacteroidales bacterium AH-315-N07]|nr:SprB repeat-containing protein [Bacteroidales bacterium AH-315-N07]